MDSPSLCTMEVTRTGMAEAHPQVPCSKPRTSLRWEKTRTAPHARVNRPTENPAPPAKMPAKGQGPAHSVQCELRDSSLWGRGAPGSWRLRGCVPSGSRPGQVVPRLERTDEGEGPPGENERQPNERPDLGVLQKGRVGPMTTCRLAPSPASALRPPPSALRSLGSARRWREPLAHAASRPRGAPVPPTPRLAAAPPRARRWPGRSRWRGRGWPWRRCDGARRGRHPAGRRPRRCSPAR